MNFNKIILSEDFDDDFTWEETDKEQVTSVTDDVDDSFEGLNDEEIKSLEKMIDEKPNQVPQTSCEVGLADTLIQAVNNGWERVREYNSLIDIIRAQDASGACESHEEMIPVITDIIQETNQQIGKLQELLKTVSASTEQITVGEFQAQRQLQDNNPGSEDLTDTCTLCNVDDEM